MFTFKNPIFAPKNDIDMFTIIGLMLTGMLLGYLLRKRNLSGIHKVITVLIWLLLFILGVFHLIPIDIVIDSKVSFMHLALSKDFIPSDSKPSYSP